MRKIVGWIFGPMFAFAQRVAVQLLIDRKTGIVWINGKCYWFRFTEVEITK